MAEPHPQKVKPDSLVAAMLVPQMKQLSLVSSCDKEVQASPELSEKKPSLPSRSRKRRYAVSTTEAAPITWGAIKRLCLNAENAVNAQGLPLTTANFFVAMLSLLSVQVSANDWSINFPEGDYRTYLDKGLIYPWNDSYIPRPLKVNRWNSHGWVAPIYTFVHENKTYYQSQLWRLPLTTHKIMLVRATTHVEQYYVQTCVSSPYSLLLSNDSEKLQIVQNNMRFYITCQQCILTTCIVPEMNVSTIIVLKRPAYIMLPVALNESWYTDIGAEIVRQVGELMRPKRFVATLILGISALIGILSSFSVATYALVKEVQTAQYANDLSKNISLALATQEAIDRKLEAKVDALEEAVLHIGQELTALKIRLSLHAIKNILGYVLLP
ncbi:endogenous retrovirus group K member 13-1 Env polyprotein-like [Lagenorhynchus albirostris]|uniref:endogenous retrovirus group K member 13-1 Env polyprotein-like n=1 Tax=Lagenorhynchus albirostris TaxID=27610 RepID=UPI0028E1DD98|nr:endogenous retrovirus group K member 13-1 Env polyprotein-like [Lagenorhynchus albirostris]